MSELEANVIEVSGKGARNALKNKRNRHSISLEQKLEIIRRTEAGERLTDVGKHYKLNTSTIKTILNNANKIKNIGLSATATSASKITRIRSVRMEKMERMLTIWVQDQTQRNLPLTSALIMAKARSIHGILKHEEDCAEAEKPFTASKGWFERFKRRNNIQSIRFCNSNNGVGESGEDEVVAEFLLRFKNALIDGKYAPQAVFNFDESGLFWKRLPHRTLTADDTETEDKERVSVLLGSNASGDFKCKPLVVYHCENPPALRGYSKENFPVIWKWNREAWVTADIFQQWFISSFCPNVISYCEKNNLEKKILLLLDNSPCHPQNLDILQSALKIELLFFPPNTNSYFQPMDQGVMTAFKAAYLRKNVSQLLQATYGKGESAIRQFWNRFDVKRCIENVGSAWDEISSVCLNAAWKNVWPDAVYNFVDFQYVVQEIVSEVVDACRVAGFEQLESFDVHQLLTAHGERLSEEQLIELDERRTRCERADRTIPDRNLTVKTISQAVNQIYSALELLAEQDPNLERSNAVKRAVIDDLACYTDILNEKRKKLKNHAKNGTNVIQNAF